MEATLAPPERGVYVTDGRRLFRIVSLVTPDGGHGSAEIEDCLTLETTTITVEELWQLDLRPVR